MNLNRRVSGARFCLARIFATAALVVLAGALALRPGFTTIEFRSANANLELAAAGKAIADPQNLGAGPSLLRFEANQGQTDSRVKFLARGSGYGLFLTAEGAVLKVRAAGPQGGRRNADTAYAIRMQLVGANLNSHAAGEGALASKSNYLIGNDPGKWRRNVAQFARVRYRQVYPGVDLVYYGNQGQLEYDFEVAPGAEPSLLQIQFEGVEKLALDGKGNLILHGGGGDLRLHAPLIYQGSGQEKRPVSGNFVLWSGKRVGFAIGEYDRSQALIIDPVLSYSSYLGGTGSENSPQIAVDAAFNLYVAGQTTSADFPPQPGVQGALSGPSDVFVAKFDPSGSNLLFSTYLGGSGDESSAGVAVDAAQNVLVAGSSNSSDFPTVNGFTNPPLSSNPHIFVSQLKPDGSGLLYSTLLGGDGTDTATGLAIDNKGNAFVIGTTTSTNFPATAGAFQTAPLATNQFVVSKVSTTLTGNASLAYSTYFGGGNPANGQAVGGGIAVDSNGNMYITGGTNFLNVSGGTDNFPILNASQPSLDCPTNTGCPSSPTALDAFVAKINPGAASGAQLVYSTYLGGSGDDIGNSIAVDSGGNAYITGSTTSGDQVIPSGTAPLQASNGGGTDAYVAKLNNPASGSLVTVTYFSYLGGSSTDTGTGIAVDSNQFARVTGWTTSGDFPSVNAGGFQTGGLGGTDAFLARLDTTATTTPVANNFASRLGGSGTDRGTGIALGSNGATYVTGDTTSGNFPTAGSPFQGSLKGSSDAFVVIQGGVSDLALTVTPSATVVGLGNQVTFKYTITNNGPDPAAGVTFTANLPATGATFNSVSVSPGSCASPVSSTVTCSVGTLASKGTATASVILTPTTGSTSLVNSASVSVVNSASTDPVPGNNTAQGSVTVTDFNVQVTPASATVTAGNSATYQVTVTPVPTYGSNISLTCSAGLPSGTKCTFSTNPVTIPSTSAVTSTLTVSTTARPIPTGSLRFRQSLWYAWFLPISGLALFGSVGKISRRRRWLMGLIVGAGLSIAVVQTGCGSGSKSTPTQTAGTPAGTYTLTVTGTSGSASHGSTTTLVVQ